GAALTARIDAGLRLPAGERVEVTVRSTSSRTATVVEGSVAIDGTSLLHHRWTGDGPGPGGQPTPETEGNVEVLGYAQPCVAHAGETVDVKVSTTQPGFSAEVVRLGLVPRPAVPQVADGHFPGREQELRSGSYLVAELGEGLPGAGHSVQFW